jgi:hypothetical protein
MPLDLRTYTAEPARVASDGETLWHSSPQAWRFVFARFAPVLGAGNLIWEALQLSFYTQYPWTWFFAILSCTVGDVMIGMASLLLAAILFGRRGWPGSKHSHVLGAAMFFGVAYTVFSEWLNTEVTMNWQYAESMLRVPPLGTGIAPLLQWLVVPPLAYWLACALGRERSKIG